MGNEIKDRATAEDAALNLNKGSDGATEGEQRTPRKKSTSEVLFPENIADDGTIVNRPIRVMPGSVDDIFPQGPATPTEPVIAPTPEAAAPTVPSILDLSKLPDNTMVRMKVDGVEMDVPAKEAWKNMQLERHLNQKAQKLAEREKELEAERAWYRQQMTKEPSPSGKPLKSEQPPVSPAESAEVTALKAEMEELRRTIAPQLYQSNVKKLSARVKENLGADDFETFVPKIQEFVDSELRKPEVAANPHAIAALDHPDFWYGKYQEMKLKALMSGQSVTPPPVNPQVPQIIKNPVVRQDGTTPIIDRSGEVRLMPSIEGSSGVPSRSSPSSDWQTQYKAAIDRAKKEGTNAAWQEVFKLKRIASDQ